MSLASGGCGLAAQPVAARRDRCRSSGPRCARRSPRRPGGRLLYCLISLPLGLATFLVVVVLLPFGLVVSGSVLGTVVGLMLVVLNQRLARRFGGWHRRLADRFLNARVMPPAPFRRPAGSVFVRVDARLRDGTGWRATGYLLLKLPVVTLQYFGLGFWLCGIVDLTYPVWWPLFRGHPAGTTLRPMPAATPPPFSGNVQASTWAGDVVGAGVRPGPAAGRALADPGRGAGRPVADPLPARAGHAGPAGPRPGAGPLPGGRRLGRAAAAGGARPARRGPGPAGRDGHEPGHGQGEAGPRRHPGRPGPDPGTGRRRPPGGQGSPGRAARTGPRHPPPGAGHRPGGGAGHAGRGQRDPRHRHRRGHRAAVGGDRVDRLLLRGRAADQRDQAQPGQQDRHPGPGRRGRTGPDAPAAGQRRRNRRRRGRGRQRPGRSAARGPARSTASSAWTARRAARPRSPSNCR